MLKFLVFNCLVAVLLGLLQGSQGTWIATSIYPSCTGTGFPNFSYAKGSNGGPGAFRCFNLSGSERSSLPPQTITWFYYASYPPPACGSGNTPVFPVAAADQCCHSTIASTITFTHTQVVNHGHHQSGGPVLIFTGNVTAGAFADHAVTKKLYLDRGTVNFNCGTTYGQEARVAIQNLHIANGPTCLKGAFISETCPGGHSQ